MPGCAWASPAGAVMPAMRIRAGDFIAFTVTVMSVLVAFSVYAPGARSKNSYRSLPLVWMLPAVASLWEPELQETLALVAF